MVSGLTNSAMNTSQDNECIVVKTSTETEQHFSDDDIQDIEMSPTDHTNGDTSDTIVTGTILCPCYITVDCSS